MNGLLLPFLTDADGSAVATPCKGADQLFTGGRYIDPPAADVARAKEMCTQCPVRAACLEWALDSGERYGVWGGMAAHERRRFRRATGEDGQPSWSGPGTGWRR